LPLAYANRQNHVERLCIVLILIGVLQQQQQKHVVMIGTSRGVGTSTLLNCLMNSRVDGLSKNEMFQSGRSSSETSSKLNSKELSDTIYTTTPGLDNTQKQTIEDTAEEITKALKKDGDYQIIFVVTLESGRLRHPDVTMITLVLDSAKEITYYWVIFNKIGKDMLESITERQKCELLAQVSPDSGPNKPVPIPLFLGVYSDLDEKSNALTSIGELNVFLTHMYPPIRINSSNVKEIATDSYEAINNKMREELTALTKNQELMKRKIEENNFFFNNKIESIMGKHLIEKRELIDMKTQVEIINKQQEELVPREQLNKTHYLEIIDKMEKDREDILDAIKANNRTVRCCCVIL